MSDLPLFESTKDEHIAQLQAELERVKKERDSAIKFRTEYNYFVAAVLRDISDFDVTPIEQYKQWRRKLLDNGLDRLLEPEQGLQDVDWNNMPSDAFYVVQHLERKSVFTTSKDFKGYDANVFKVLATRPKPKKPPLSEITGQELVAELLATAECDASRDDLQGHIERFLKGRGNE